MSVRTGQICLAQATCIVTAGGPLLRGRSGTRVFACGDTLPALAFGVDGTCAEDCLKFFVRRVADFQAHIIFCLRRASRYAIYCMLC